LTTTTRRPTGAHRSLAPWKYRSQARARCSSESCVSGAVHRADTIVRANARHDKALTLLAVLALPVAVLVAVEPRNDRSRIESHRSRGARQVHRVSLGNPRRSWRFVVFAVRPLRSGSLVRSSGSSDRIARYPKAGAGRWYPLADAAPGMPNGGGLEAVTPLRTFRKRSGSSGNPGSLLVRAGITIVGIPRGWRRLDTRGYPDVSLRTGVRFPSHSRPAGPARAPAQ
jgi:hypothetical protein